MLWCTLDLVLRALVVDPDTYLLVPQPGFSILYQKVICETMGAYVLPLSTCYQNEIGKLILDHVQSLLLLTMVTSYSRFPPGHHHDDQDDHHHLIRGIVVNNPSNPTGDVYSLQHLQHLVTICNHYHLPIVADEILW